MMGKLRDWHILNFFSVLLIAVLHIQLTALREKKTQTVHNHEVFKIAYNN